MRQREKVYGVPNYYDGVLSGVADFGGQPHAFMIDDDPSRSAPVYRLVPIPAETLDLYLEEWRIWRRWEAGRDQNRVPSETVAALPEDRERLAAIKPRLATLLEVPPDSPLRAKGSFMPRRDGNPEVDGPWAMDVEWSDP
jgi:hypothetical protein